MSKEFQAACKKNGVAPVARLLGVSRQRVQHWMKGRIPAEWVRPVESVTGIPKEKLRPDLYA